MSSRSSRSSFTSMAIIILSHLGGNCELAVLPLLVGISDIEFSHCIQEIDELDLLTGDIDTTISITPFKRIPRTIMEPALFSSSLFSENTVASAIYSYYQKDLRRFLEQALATIKFLTEKDKPLAIRRAYDALAYGILKMRVPLHDKDFCLYFIEKCMNIQREIIRLPGNSRNQILLFCKIKGIAFYIGDKRSTGYINICMGSINQNLRSKAKASLYHRNMKNGIDLVFSIGDKDIILMSSAFIILYYILEANFSEGVNFAISVLLSEDEDSEAYLNTALYSYAAICAINMGNYELANDFLTFGIDKNLHSPRAINISINSMRAILAYVYILQRRYDEALGIIQSLLGAHGNSMITYADLWSSRALAFYHYKRGDIEQSYIAFQNLLPDRNYNGISHSNYLIAPFVLELLGSYYTAGHLDSPEKTIYEELKYSMAAPSKLVQAVAFRVAGQICAHENGWDNSQVINYLEKSLSLFRCFTAPPDMSKTLLELARVYQTNGLAQKANAAASEAKEICQQYNQPFWPNELAPLLVKSTNLSPIQKKKSFDIKIQLMHNICSQAIFSTNGNLLNSLLVSLLATFGISSGQVYRANDSHLELKASINMNGTLDRTKNLIEKSLNNKQSIVTKGLYKNINNLSNNLTQVTIIIFVNALNHGIYLFNLSGIVMTHTANQITNNFLTFVENYLATHIFIYMAQAAEWQERFKSSTASADYQQDNSELIFRSLTMKTIIDRVDNLAKKDTTVLILGESGVGKELIAKRLHLKSLRKGDFVSVSLSNIPYELFESECFGHEKGSFTGANYQKKGLFEIADTGTIFIDEIGDLSLSLQVKLLRVLQEKKFIRIGGTKPLFSNFRLITATNRDLATEVHKGHFREDLYYRLNVVSIFIPPLRERKDDILFLVEYYLRYYCTKYQIPLKHISGDVKQKIMNYPWPGNVRELKNYMERYCVLSGNDCLFPPISCESHCQESRQVPLDATSGIFFQKLSLQDLADKYFEYIYTVTNGMVGGPKGVASILGISRTTAYSWIDRLGLKEKYTLTLSRSSISK